MKTVFFVAAASNSGKTTLIEKVVRKLKAAGFRVAVVKHASKGFELDTPGKDSWRFQKAGADVVALVGPGKTATISMTEREPGPDEIPGCDDVDIVLHEGFKATGRNKIEVFRAGVSGEQPLCIDDPSYIALVSDKRFDLPIPVFDLNDTDGVAEFIAGGRENDVTIC